MRSIRSVLLCSFGCFVLAASSVMTFAQPGGQPPAPASAPKDQPSGDRPRDPQNAPRPDGMRGQPGDGGGRRGQGGGAQQGVKQGMSMMNRALRTLKGSVSDAAKKDENLKAINDLQRGCVAAKGAMPDRALGKMEEAKRAEAGIKYRRALIQIMEKALKAETAIMDGKSAEAAKIVAEIEKLRDESHTTMGVHDDDEGRGPGGPDGPGGGRDGAPGGR